MKEITKVVRETDWRLFALQKQWLIEQNGEHVDGLLNWIDAMQDAIIADGIEEECVVFPYKGV